MNHIVKTLKLKVSPRRVRGASRQHQGQVALPQLTGTDCRLLQNQS